MPYKGKGVVVGMIDTGIDFLHPDFKDTANKTRIQYLWDMNQDSGTFTPLPYGYGKAWCKRQIDSVMATHDTTGISTMDSSSTLEYAHGSNVSGIATGNGRSNHSCIGAAPEADIMMVAYNFTNQTNNEMTDAVNYIYTQADILGEPCVINASLGDYDGSHDGSDLQAQMIDGMVTAKPGRVFVAASGNASNIPYHLSVNNIPGDTSFSWFSYYSYNWGSINFDAWADTNNFKNVQYAIGVDRINPYSFVGRTNFSTVLTKLGVWVTDTIKNAKGNRIGIVNTYSQLNGSIYSLNVSIQPDSTQSGQISNDSSYYWRFITTGSGKIDCWYADPTPIVNSGLPNASIFPDIKNYKLPDTVSTLCSSFQCSPNVITVGDYRNRVTLIDYDTVLYTTDTNKNHLDGELALYSGVGPTRDGRIKPDITSPGDFCLTVLPTTMRQLYITSSGGRTVIDTGGYHDVDGGTSMASPGVAGVAALYLQMYPSATNSEVRSAIIYCSTEDSFTGTSLPNNTWGYGKVNAFKSLTGCALGVPTVPQPPVSILTAYPNPMKDGTIIQYDFSSIKEYCTANIFIYDVMGQRVSTLELKNNNGTINFDKGNLSTGTYFYSLSIDGNTIKTEKLIVTK
jgi:subtilisin family serine protease